MQLNTKYMTIQQKQSQQGNKKELLLYLSVLTILFLCMQISYFIKFSGFYLGDMKEVANHLSIPFKVIPPMVFFIFIQLVIHFLLVLFIGFVTFRLGDFFALPINTIEKLGLYLWGVSIFCIVFANQYYFPNSKFSNLTQSFVPQVVSHYFVLISFFILAISTFIAVYSVVKNTIFIIAALIFVVFFGMSHRANNPVMDAATPSKPNVILIGIDSLRPDYLGFFGYEKITPHLDNFLNRSTVFAESLTPLARTFPAWVSILTGKYPKQSGARTNLEDPRHLDLRQTLPALLRNQSYFTIFATDETRFSNIDQQFGFDHVITPPIGLNDFLIGAMNDFPLSNLLVNTTLGRWLFPYNYGNRPAFATYDPDSFLNLLKPELSQSRTKPLFLAVHFCLPHFPYFWGKEPLNSQSIKNYQAAVNRVDKQFYDFFEMLEKDNLLQHSLVILLSDHGEAIELHGDRVTDPDLFVAGNNNPKHLIPHFYPPMLETEKVDESAGHGTDVLGLPQYHTVLAMQSRGLAQDNQIKVVSGRVSLLDIKPTVLDLLKMNFQKETGRSLKSVLVSKNDDVSSPADFFIESDFSPEAIRTVHPDQREVLFEGINFFQINSRNARVIVKPDMEKMIITSKQFADFHGEWVLALYPEQQKMMIPILVNLRTGEWTNELHTHFARQSPAKYMLSALRNFYGDEIIKIESE